VGVTGLPVKRGKVPVRILATVCLRHGTRAYHAGERALVSVPDAQRLVAHGAAEYVHGAADVYPGRRR
jgi:hypothetical protein